jgi:hypothetical protein
MRCVWHGAARVTGAGRRGRAALRRRAAGVQPAVYVAKVKNLLVGLPPTDAEVKAVEAHPSQLGALVDGWMRLPQYQARMLRFFELAFQQTQVTIADFADQSYPHASDINGTTAPLLVQNASESFARTVLELIAEGRPFTEAMTTTRFMMTPGLMEYYAFLDAVRPRRVEGCDGLRAGLRAGPDRLSGQRLDAALPPARRPRRAQEHGGDRVRTVRRHVGGLAADHVRLRSRACHRSRTTAPRRRSLRPSCSCR